MIHRNKSSLQNMRRQQGIAGIIVRVNNMFIVYFKINVSRQKKTDTNITLHCLNTKFSFQNRKTLTFVSPVLLTHHIIFSLNATDDGEYAPQHISVYT